MVVCEHDVVLSGHVFTATIVVVGMQSAFASFKFVSNHYFISACHGSSLFFNNGFWGWFTTVFLFTFWPQLNKWFIASFAYAVNSTFVFLCWTFRSSHLTRLRLVLARRKRLALVMMSDSLCVSVFVALCLLFVCYANKPKTQGWMLHPPDCPTWFPLHSSPDYVYRPPRRFASLTSSYMIEGAPIYPRYRVSPTAVRMA